MDKHVEVNISYQNKPIVLDADRYEEKEDDEEEPEEEESRQEMCCHEDLIIQYERTEETLRTENE